MSNVNMRVVGLGNKVKSEYTFEEISFNLCPGEIVGLFGHNGSGKSTLHRILANLEPAISGKVEINGIVNDFNTFRTDVVLIPDTVMLFPRKSIIDNFKFITRCYQVDMEFFVSNLKEYDLEQSMRICDLSKGNQEMVQLLIYLSVDADIYILDEPFGAVDIFRRKAIKKLFIETLLRNQSASIILTTHLINDVESLLDRVIYLDNKHIKFDIDTDTILETSSSVVEYIEQVFEKGGNNEIIYRDDQ